MLNFKPVELSDKEWIQPFFDLSSYRCMEYSFSFTYMWRNIFKYNVARYENYVIIQSYREGRPPSYLFPAGNGDIKPVIEALKAHSNGLGANLVFHAIPAEARPVLEQAFPGEFEYMELVDYYDYIYDAQSLATLEGKKLKSKRNHINYFTSAYENWSFQPITRENMPAVREMQKLWLEIEAKEDTSISFADESTTVNIAIDDYFELGLSGGVLFADDKVVAFTMGDRITEDTFIVHIEKAFKDIRGAYPKINQEFAKIIAKEYKYINREDDSGNPGLRKAKESYRPVSMGEKVAAKYIK